MIAESPTTTTEDQLAHAKVLVELGELHLAEIEVAEVLDEHPDDLTALNLFAKIKHIRGELSQAIACLALPDLRLEAGDQLVPIVGRSALQGRRAAVEEALPPGGEGGGGDAQLS